MSAAFATYEKSGRVVVITLNRVVVLAPQVQERGELVEPDKLEQFMAVCNKWDVLATVIGTQVQRSYTVYGRIPAGQFVSPGTYANTLTVAVNF